MCNCTCRIFLFIINVIVGVAGFLLMLFGGMLSWGKSVMREQIADHIGPLFERMYGPETALRVTHLTEFILRFTAPFGVVIFGFGTVILILCVFGCCGACCNKAVCLKIYTALLILIAFAEIALLTFYYTNRPVVFDLTRKLLDQSLEKYQSFESEDSNSMIFNVMMPAFNCCGLADGNDFKRALDFQRTVNVTGENITLEYPVSCCKMDSDFQILHDSCPAKFDEMNSNYNRGCWDVLYPKMLYYGNALAIAGIVLLLFQVLLIVMSVVTLALKQI